MANVRRQSTCYTVEQAKKELEGAIFLAMGLIGLDLVASTYLFIPLFSACPEYKNLSLLHLLQSP